jgi:hypothetical protein
MLMTRICDRVYLFVCHSCVPLYIHVYISIHTYTHTYTHYAEQRDCLQSPWSQCWWITTSSKSRLITWCFVIKKLCSLFDMYSSVRCMSLFSKQPFDIPRWSSEGDGRVCWTEKRFSLFL